MIAAFEVFRFALHDKVKNIGVANNLIVEERYEGLKKLALVPWLLPSPALLERGRGEVYKFFSIRICGMSNSKNSSPLMR